MAASLCCYGFGHISFWSEIAVFVLYFFVFVWVFVDVLIVNDLLFYISTNLLFYHFGECLLRSKEKKQNALINARHCRAFYNCCTITCIYIYQLLVHLVYSGNSTKIYGFFFFLNHVQTHVMIFYTYIYILFLHCIGICAQDYL